MCSEGICSRVLIDTLHRSLIDTQLTSWLTIDWHLNRESADTQLIHGRPGVNWLMYWSTYCWLRCPSSSAHQVSTEVSIECSSSVDQGYQSILNHGFLYTWSHLVDKTSTSTASQLPSYSSEIPILPFLHWGALILPCRALPVPFCLQGFLPPPLLSLRFLTLAVPCKMTANNL